MHSLVQINTHQHHCDDSVNWIEELDHKANAGASLSTFGAFFDVTECEKNSTN